MTLGKCTESPALPPEAQAALREACAVGLRELSAGRFDKAEELFSGVLEVMPDQPDALHLLGVIRLQQGRVDDSIGLIAKAIKANGNEASYHNNLASAYEAAGRLGLAERAAQRAIELEPELADGHYNLGNVVRKQGRYEEARDCYAKAVELRPDFALAAWNKGLVTLSAGDWASGWPDYDRRWETPQYRAHKRPFDLPWWRGEDIGDRCVLVWSEQGVGDELMFANALPDLLDRAGGCVIECDPRFVPLFARSFPGAEVVASSEPPDPRLSRDDIDLQSPSGSLLRWLRPTAESFPNHHGYVKPDMEKAKAIRARYRDRGNGPMIGIAWRSGNAAHGESRSFDLTGWEPILRGREAVFVNLQYGDIALDLAEVRSGLGVDIVNDTEVDQLASLDDFAAQVAALDLVITIDNSTAHMAGALGVPVWIMLAEPAEWRWGRAGEDCVWYPSARLFRQRKAGKWGSVVKAVSAALDDDLQGISG